MDLITRFDGTERQPRPLQIEALKYVAENFGKRPIVIQAGTGVGKSGIARALQLHFGSAIVVPQNVLLDQYAETYPTVNTLKGQDHYEHADDYYAAKGRAKGGEPSIFNPLSLFYLDYEPNSLIVDEAHKLPEMMQLLCGVELSQTQWKYPGSTPEVLVPYFAKMVEHCRKLGASYRETKNVKDSVKYYAMADKFDRIGQRLEVRDPNFVIYEEERKLATKVERYLIIKPVKLPDGYLAMVRQSRRVVLMSATIPRSRAAAILGTTEFDYLDMASPIPKSQRPILFRPDGLTSRSSPLEVAVWVKKQLAEFEGNAILHVTYSMGKALAKHFPDAHIHTTDIGSKASTLKKFKKTGGLWIAAGCSEGIDLPGEEARLNLVPILPFANIGDPLVKARLALPGGNDDYALNTLITFVQMVGRSTRGENDFSVTVCGDNRLAQNVAKLKSQLPSSFLEAINWKGK
jgi:Rad3-related DNA helicase